MSKINYEELTEITVKSQEELGMIPDDFAGRIFIKFGTRSSPAIVDKLYKHPVVACGNSFVVAWNNSSVNAYDNSSVEARNNSSVNAYDNSSVEARNNSSVNACDNSSVTCRHASSVTASGHSCVKAKDHSSVEARDNSVIIASQNSSVIASDKTIVIAWDYSSIKAWGKSFVKAYHYSCVKAMDRSSVEAWDNSSIEAWDNSSVNARGNSSVENLGNGSVQASGNSQIMNYQLNPKTIDEYVSFYDIKHTKKTGHFFKAVHRSEDGYFYSNHDLGFRYVVGETIHQKCDPNNLINCSYGIHISHLDWALTFGFDWGDLAVIEVETDLDKVVVPFNGGGKVRTSEVKVLREVPLEKCGVYGKMLARRHRQA